MTNNSMTKDHFDLEQELHLHKFAIDEHAIVAITDPGGVINYVNDKFCAISKYDRDELIGHTHRIINSGYHPKSFFVEMWKAIAGGKTWRGEVCNRAKDGSLYWVDTTIVPFKDRNGKICQYIAIRADITDRKAVEEKLLSANRELEEFVYTASHDLKSPLLTIEGFAGFIKEYLQEGEYEKCDQCVDRISQAVQRMRTNIDDLLELSRIGRLAPKCEMVPLQSVVSELLFEFDVQIASAGATVVLGNNLPSVWCDPEQLKQLLSNLISNALKYGKREGGTICITIGARTVKNEIHLFVADNGPGITENYHKKVFELFQRLNTTAEGTGVGLNIVKRIAEIHGGRAWIEETPGGGATFVVSFSAVMNNPPLNMTLSENNTDD